MPGNEVIISVRDLGKRYNLGATLRHNTLRDKVSDAVQLWASRVTGSGRPREAMGQGENRRPPAELWALKNVSFDVKRGEVVGIIGHNGAGKSTLLKILSQITEPTEGEVRLRGRVASLLEVGTGMHPELSGRENVYLNGAILGMRKAEIDAKYEEIVDFAGIADFMATPIKRYSSGMRVRLGFAIAAHLDPELLLIDEVLAVGDMEFRKKCLGRMQQVAEGGRTVLFVSHNMAAVKSLCSRTLLLSGGKLVIDGPTLTVLPQYLALGSSAWASDDVETHTHRTGSQAVTFAGFHIEDDSGRCVDTVSVGDDVRLVFRLKVNRTGVSKVDVGFSLHDIFGTCLSVLYSSFQDRYWAFAKEGYECVRCTIPGFAFAPGRITVKGRLLAEDTEADWPRPPLGIINVEQGDFYGTGRSGKWGDVPFLIKGNWV